MKRLALLVLFGLAACEVAGTTTPIDPAAPTNLSFQLTPSGDPNIPLGILLTWVAPSNGRAATFDIYGLSASTGWIRRATTTSTSFHDAGVPQAQYYVAAIDDQGAEMGRSAIVTVDLANRLAAPLGLTSITLNGAIQLSWSDNAVQRPAGRPSITIASTRADTAAHRGPASSPGTSRDRRFPTRSSSAT